MDASDLRIFEAAVRVGNITKAAAALHTVQSNVTTRIKFLEQELGVVLLHRHARGVSPTIAGQKLLPYALRFAQLLAEAKSAVNEAAVPHGKLVFGTLETTAAMRLPPVLTKYKKQFPNVDLVIRTGTTRELIDGVLRHELEGAFIAGASDHSDLIEQVMFPEELVLIGSPTQSPSETMSSGFPPDLLMLKSGCSYRTRLKSIVTSHGIYNYRILELGTIEAIVGLVSAGVGISLLPRIVVARAHDEGRISMEHMPYDFCRVNTVFIRRKDGFFSNAARYLADYMMDSNPVDRNEPTPSVVAQSIKTDQEFLRAPLLAQ
jgi:DNA-binding transcriptional LysR family regulator